MNATINKTTWLKWGITLLVPLAIYFLVPASEAYSLEIRKYFLLTMICIFLFVFELLPGAIIGLCLTIGYPLLKVCSLQTALSTWGNSLIFQSIAILLLIECLQNTTLLKRVSYKLAGAVSGSYLGILLGLALSGVVLAIMIPASTASFINMALALGLIKSLKLSPKEPATVGFMLVSFFSVIDAHNFLYSTFGIGLGANLIAATVEGFSLSYTKIILDNLIFILQLFILVPIIAKVFPAKQKLNGKEFFYDELAALGKWSATDKKALVIMILMIVFLMTNSLHGLDMTFGFIGACILFYLPKIEIGTTENLQSVSISFPIIVASCMAIGTVGSSIGVGNWFADLVAPLLQSSSKFTFTFFIMIFGVLANILMTPMALLTLLTGPFVTIAQTMGFSPEVIAYTLYHISNDVFFPYENNGTLMCYAFGMMSMRQFMKGALCKMILDFVFVLTLGILWWSIVGLF